VTTVIPVNASVVLMAPKEMWVLSLLCVDFERLANAVNAVTAAW